MEKLLYWQVQHFANFPFLKNEAVRYLKPLPDHATININGSLTSEDVFRTVVSMAVNRNSVHSVTAQHKDVECETSLRYHLEKLNVDD
jgi:putative transposase